MASNNFSAGKMMSRHSLSKTNFEKQKTDRNNIKRGKTKTKIFTQKSRNLISNKITQTSKKYKIKN